MALWFARDEVHSHPVATVEQMQPAKGTESLLPPSALRSQDSTEGPVPIRRSREDLSRQGEALVPSSGVGDRTVPSWLHSAQCLASKPSIPQ